MSISSNHPRIYLVDDDQDDREMFTAALSLVHPDADVTELCDGQQLLDAVAENPGSLPDYIFLDLNMPKCGGMECIEKMLHDNRMENVTIAVLSTSSNPESIDKAFRLGANFYIVKPTSFSNLKAFIIKVLDGSPQSTKPKTIKEFLLAN